MERRTDRAGRLWRAWFGGRPAARAVALFSGLNLFMITLYAFLFALSMLAAAGPDAPWSSLLARGAVVALPVALAAALYGAVVFSLRPGARSRLELGGLALLGLVAVGLTTSYLDMPFLSLALVPVVARYWLGLRPTLLLGGAIIAWSVAWFAFLRPQETGAPFAVALVIGAFAVLFGGYTLLSFEFALREARAREELDALYDELERSYRRLRGYRELEIEHAHLEERSRVSRELHDTLGHHLTAQRFDLQVLRKLLERPAGRADAGRADAGGTGAAVERALDRNAEAFADLRRAVQALRPERFERLDLGDALHGLVRRSAAPSLVGLEIEGEGAAGALPPEAALVLYRSAQEALTNALKHAPEERLELRLAFGPESVALTAANPVPAGMEGAGGTEPGVGLVGLRERAEALGGSLAAGRHGREFRLRLELPREPAPAAAAPAPATAGDAAEVTGA